MTRMLDRPLRSVAQKVLKIFGSDVTHRVITGTAYNTTTGSMAPTTADKVMKGRLDEFLDRELSDRVRAGDRKLTVAAADCVTVPKESDKFVIATLEWDVVRLLTTLATDDAAIYTVQVRR